MPKRHARGANRKPQRDLWYPSLVLLVIWLSLAASVGIALPSVGRLDDGVLVSDEVIVGKANGEHYDPQFAEPLRQGVEFKVVEDRGGRVPIELADGNSGWVRKRDVELFRRLPMLEVRSARFTRRFSLSVPPLRSARTTQRGGRPELSEPQQLPAQVNQE